MAQELRRPKGEAGPAAAVGIASLGSYREGLLSVSSSHILEVIWDMTTSLLSHPRMEFLGAQSGSRSDVGPRNKGCPVLGCAGPAGHVQGSPLGILTLAP